MIPPPPRSTLFPYTTLPIFERLLVRIRHEVKRAGRRVRDQLLAQLGRSEEHTSELQSHSDLVCRLLLEKKKTKLLANFKADRLRTFRVVRAKNHVTESPGSS